MRTFESEYQDSRANLREAMTKLQSLVLEALKVIEDKIDDPDTSDEEIIELMHQLDGLGELNRLSHNHGLGESFKDRTRARIRESYVHSDRFFEELMDVALDARGSGATDEEAISELTAYAEALFEQEMGREPDPDQKVEINEVVEKAWDASAAADFNDD